MKGSSVEFAPACVLQRRHYRETSLLIEVFSSATGREGLVARGVCRPRSRLQGLLQPFRPLLLSWRAGADLGILTGAEPNGPVLPLNGEQIFYGWYLNELLLRLLQRHDPHPHLFPHYVGALSAIATEPHVALRRFEKRLLEAIGYGLPLDATLETERWYRFDPEAGVQEVSSKVRGSVAGEVLADLRGEHFDRPETRRQIRAVLRDAINRQLGGRPLRTPILLREMRRQRVERA